MFNNNIKSIELLKLKNIIRISYIFDRYTNWLFIYFIIIIVKLNMYISYVNM